MCKSAIAVAGVILTVIGGSLWAKGQTTSGTQLRSECSLEQKGDFSPGWLELRDGSSYRCMPTFDAALKPSGAAWVRVEPDGTIGRHLPR